MTIEELREKGWIVYEYIRGSHSYNLNIETSDEDRGGVFICPQEYLYGLRNTYIEQVSDSKGDTVFYEIGRWFELLLKSNPTALESLFVDDEFIISMHPIIKQIRDNRNLFLSQECFKSLGGYAISQIQKARGLNKKIVNPITERKSVLDFCYIPHKQGSTKLIDFLNNNGLKQKYCGLVQLPNMHDTYGLYYDWGTHIICEYNVDFNIGKNVKEAWNIICEEMDNWEDNNTNCFGDSLLTYVFKNPYETYYNQFKNIKPYGFTGIVSENNESNEVRVCIVPKNLQPITYMTYNKNGYESFCRDYKEYKEWEKNRNPIRYESNLDKNYDSKNIMHCMRLIRMAKELAQGKGFIVKRTEDRDYLLDIRNHKFEYDEIMKQVEKEKEEMNYEMHNSKLPLLPDFNMINNLLITSRKQYEKENGGF